MLPILRADVMSCHILEWRWCVQVRFPFLVWWLNFVAGVAIRTQIVRRPLLGVMGVQHLAVFVQLQNVGEDGIDLLNGARLISIQRQVIHHSGYAASRWP